MTLTRNQILAIVIAILGVLMASTAQLTDLVGPQVTKVIQSLAGIANSILASILAVITGQSGIIRDASAMPGVEKITVNSQANSTLATLAVDPSQSKIQPTPQAAQAVQATATAAAA